MNTGRRFTMALGIATLALAAALLLTPGGRRAVREDVRAVPVRPRMALSGWEWLFLGLLVGSLGYCPLTDWHFQVLEKLGRTDLPVSYVKYLADRITGLNFNSGLIDSITLYSFLAALAISVILNIRDFLKARSRKSG